MRALIGLGLMLIGAGCCDLNKKYCQEYICDCCCPPQLPAQCEAGYSVLGRNENAAVQEAAEEFAEDVDCNGETISCVCELARASKAKSGTGARPVGARRRSWCRFQTLESDRWVVGHFHPSSPAAPKRTDC
jgi:hypothetical protein